MRRSVTGAGLLLLLCSLATSPATAAAPPRRWMEEERKEALRRLNQINSRVVYFHSLGRLGAAIPNARAALELAEDLYPPGRFPDGHPDLLDPLNNLAYLLALGGDPAAALPHALRGAALTEKLYPAERFPAGQAQVANSINTLGFVYRALGEHSRALRCYERSLALTEKLYPPERFKDGHHQLAVAVNNIGAVLLLMGEPGRALHHFERGLAMAEKLYPPERFPDGHPDLARAHRNQAVVLQRLGELALARRHFERALALYEKLYPPERFKAGHPDLAHTLDSVGAHLQMMNDYPRARAAHEKAVALYEKLYPAERFANGHPDLADALLHLGGALLATGKRDQARPYYERALAMYEKLYPPERFPNGHPDLVRSLNNMGRLIESGGDPERALPSFRRSVAVAEKLYPPGHPHLALALNNLAHLLEITGQPAESRRHFERALADYRRFLDRELSTAPEAQALAMLRLLPRTRDAYLSLGLRFPVNAEDAHEAVWASKGLTLRVLRQRHEGARVAALKSPEARWQWDRLREVRRSVSRLLSAGPRGLPGRDEALEKLTREQDDLERALSRQVPALTPGKEQALPKPADLLRDLPRRSVFVDWVRYAQADRRGDFQAMRYAAFVLAPGQPVRRVELGEADAIDRLLDSWLKSIARREDSSAPRKLHDAVWAPVARQLPAGTDTVFLCPDGGLWGLPFAALPGSKAGSVLLEDVTLACVPSGAWLAEQLHRPARGKAGPLLALGGVDYGKPAREGEGYPALPESAREVRVALAAFGMPAESALSGARATREAVLQQLPGAGIAHLATHGYFDYRALDEEQRRAFEDLRRPGLRAEVREGLGARNPLGFVGLVLAGGNQAERAAIVTGLDIVDLDLGRLRLCVLSACETGLGRYTEGEGLMGLQRAFHVAGCPNVVGSLWQVNDSATAALMGQFYHELRVNRRSVREALREAQLTLYRHPERIAALAGERGRPERDKAVKLGSAPAPLAEKAKRAEPRLWAAFVLSGLGERKIEDAEGP